MRRRDSTVTSTQMRRHTVCDHSLVPSLVRDSFWISPGRMPRPHTAHNTGTIALAAST